ncbi:ABC transporter substrate-binding protein [Actinosynnema pretiosum]|uniref:Sugar ABC transporter substrate-binding protein n=2 Tax=Actinosynnema TaxID=40566 RepID=A0A290Z340_9PSEU|nr:sugar ABC transporter substrate-binding protein [Actinosynnema pretiosum]ATE53418.1 hypothetical protein CNX65_09025 [Actinosynnema pretiosum]
MRFRALLTAAAVLAASACGANPDEPEKVTLTWWDSYESATADEAARAMVQRYQDAHPEVEVKRTSIPRAEIRAKLDQAATSGAFPDVVVVDQADLPRLAKQNAITDLTELFEQWETGGKFLGPVRASVTWSEKVWGVPLRTETNALLYNRDLMLGAPPTTWEGLRTTAKALTNPQRSGLCFAGLPGEELTTTFLPLLWQSGGDLTDLDGAADALGFLHDLMAADGSVPNAVLGWDGAQAAQAVASGSCAMVIGGTSSVKPLNSSGMAWSVAPLPAGPAGEAAALSGETWVIGKGARSTEAAWDLVRSLADDEENVTQLGAGLGGLPNRSDTVADPAWQWDPSVAGFAAQLETARPRVAYGSNYPQLSEVVWTMVQRVLKGGEDPQTAASEAKRAATPLLTDG